MSNLPTGTTDADIDRAFDGGEEIDHWCPTCKGRRPGLLYVNEWTCEDCDETTYLWEER